MPRRLRHRLGENAARFAKAKPERKVTAQRVAAWFGGAVWAITGTSTMCYQYILTSSLRKRISFIQIDRTAKLGVQRDLELLHRLLAVLCSRVVCFKFVVQCREVLL